MMSQATSTAASGPNADDRQEQALVHIRSALAGLRYGSVVVTVQDGVVVQIDRTEKNRLTAPLNGRHTSAHRNRSNGAD